MTPSANKIPPVDPGYFERNATPANPPLPLCAEEAESALLYSILGDGSGDLIQTAMQEGLRVDDFYIVRNGWVFDAMCELSQQGIQIDFITLSERLRQRGQFDEVGGTEYLYSLDHQVIRGLMADPARTRWYDNMSYDVRSYAKIIKDTGTRRRFLEALRNASRLAYDERAPFAVQFDRIDHLIGEHRPFDPNKEFVFGTKSTFSHADELAVEAKQQGWLPQPWTALTNRAPVVNLGDLVVIVGPEGSGKSAMLMNWAEFYAREHQIKTCYIHTEMNKRRVFNRRLAANSEVPYIRLAKPESLTDQDWKRIVKAGAEMEVWLSHLNYWHPETVDEDHLFGTMQRMVDDHGTKVFVLDYLNDVIPDRGAKQNEASAWQRLLARMESFNNKNDTVIVTAAQLNDQGGAYQIGRALKQKAALYIKLEPKQLKLPFPFEYGGMDYQYLPGDYGPVVQCRIEKYRDGGRGVFDLLFVGPRFLWTDVPTGFDRAVDDDYFMGSKD